MTTIVNTNNLASAPANHPLDAQKVFPILEEATAERTSDLALRTLQASLSKLSKESADSLKQLSTECNQFSLKLDLILQNQDRLSKELALRKQPIPPPPPPSSKISSSPQTTTTLTSEIQSLTGNLRRSQPLRIKADEGPIATQDQVAKGLKNLRSSKNGNETSTIPLDTKPILLTENFSQPQLKYVEKEKPEIEETLSVAAIREKFKGLSQKAN